MLSILVEGVLTSQPVSRASSKGQPYTTAKLRASGEDGETVWCSVIAFNADAAHALLDLAAGDAVAVAGHAALNRGEQNGETRAGLRVTASRVLSAYEAWKRRGAQKQDSAPA